MIRLVAENMRDVNMLSTTLPYAAAARLACDAARKDRVADWSSYAPIIMHHARQRDSEIGLTCQSRPLACSMTE